MYIYYSPISFSGNLYVIYILFVRGECHFLSSFPDTIAIII